LRLSSNSVVFILSIFKHFWFWFGPLSLSLKFKDDQISGCWHIQLLIFWACIQLDIIFISSIFYFGLVPWALFRNLRKIRSVFAEIFNFKYFEFVFHWRLSSFQAFLILVWSLKLNFKIWGRSNQCLLRYSTFDILRSSSIGGRLPLKVVFISSIFYFG
jgi:hypothetical protein